MLTYFAIGRAAHLFMNHCGFWKKNCFLNSADQNIPCNERGSLVIREVSILVKVGVVPGGVFMKKPTPRLTHSDHAGLLYAKALRVCEKGRGNKRLA